MKLWILSAACVLTLTGQALPQQDSEAWRGLVERINSEPGKASPLKDIFAEIATMIDRIDLEKVTALVDRSEDLERELKMLEYYRSQLGVGSLVTLPPALSKGLDAFPPDESYLQEVEADIVKLNADYRLHQAKLEELRRSKPQARTITEAQKGSRAAEAALAIDLELPEAPKTPASAKAATSDEAMDNAGMARALYRQGDYAMALRAWSKLNETEVTIDILYYMARCRDLLGKWSEAEKGYEGVLAKAPESYWAENAKWMLDFGRQKQRIRNLIDKPTPGGATGK